MSQSFPGNELRNTLSWCYHISYEYNCSTFVSNVWSGWISDSPSAPGVSRDDSNSASVTRVFARRAVCDWVTCTKRSLRRNTDVRVATIPLFEPPAATRTADQLTDLTDLTDSQHERTTGSRRRKVQELQGLLVLFNRQAGPELLCANASLP